MKHLKVFLICVACAFLGSFTAVLLENNRMWPKWLGGSYVSSHGCVCKDFNPENGQRDFHWLICPIKGLWGWKDMGQESTAIIHYDRSCFEHGHLEVNP